MKNPYSINACLLACSIGLSACSTYPADKASALVTAPYPGRNESGGCKPYADALFKALKSHHIAAWEVCYLGGCGAESYQHAMVVYKDAGAFWYVDNIFPYPTRSWGHTPQEWIEERSNAQTTPQNGVDIFSQPPAYCALLKVDTTAADRFSPAAPRHQSRQRINLLARQ